MDTQAFYRTGKPFELAGLTLKLQPLDSDSIENLDQWVRERHILLGVSTAKKVRPTDPESADLILSLHSMQAATMTFMSGLGAKVIATPEGMAQLLWEASGNKSEFTPKDITKEMYKPENVKRANKHLAALQPGKGGSKAKGKKGGKSKPKRKRTKK